jgi:hypothetical protein
MNQSKVNPVHDLILMQEDEHYFKGVGKNYLSKSSIGPLLWDVRTFHVETEDNINFELGSYFHHLLIEPEKAQLEHVVKSTTRTTKIYKEYVKANDIPFAVLESEKNNIELCAKAMYNIEEFNDAIYNIENEYEQPAVGELNGVWWRGKVDIVAPDMLYDLKTTGDIKRFVSSAYKYNYDVQAYVYRELFGKPMTFLVVCKKTLLCGRYTCSDEFYLSGQHKVEKAVEKYNEYFGPNATKDSQKYFINKTL